MAFIPNLPTWHNTVTVYKFDPALRTYGLYPQSITGQVYTPQRTQDEQTGETLYFVYPKTKDFLRGLKDYNDVGRADVITFSIPHGEPGARLVGYEVREVQPRWLKFPNQHLMATLQRLTPSMLDLVIDGEEFPALYPSTVVPYLRHPTLNYWVQGTSFPAKLLCGEVGEPGTAWPAAFLEYSATATQQLRDPSFFNYDPYHDFPWPGAMDAVAIVQPSSAISPSLFWVVSVLTRDLGLLTERRTAYLKRATSEQAALIVGGGVIDVDLSSIVASPTIVPADGLTAATITVTLHDEDDAPIPGKLVSVAADSGSADVDPASVLTDGLGQAVFGATDATPENDITFTATIAADSVDVGPSNAVDFLPDDIGDAGASGIAADPVAQLADGVAEVAVTVTYRNVFGDVLPGKTLTCVADSGSSTIVEASVVTDGAGLAVFTALNAVAETGITYTASCAADSVSVGPSNAVDWTEDPPPPENSQTRQMVFSASDLTPFEPQAEWFPDGSGDFAYADMTPSMDGTQTLICVPSTPFTLPSDCTVVGFEITYRKAFLAETPQSVQDDVLVIQTDEGTGDSQATSDDWPASEPLPAEITIGGPADLLGLDPLAALPDEINDSFRFGIRAGLLSGTDDTRVFVWYPVVTVFFEPA